MHTTRKILALLLVLCTALSFAACVGEAGDPLDDISNGKLGATDANETSDDVSGESKDETPEGKTAVPVITAVVNKDADTVILCGTCEENAAVSASGFGLKSAVSVNAKGTSFAMALDLVNATATVELSATVDGKEESASVKQAISKMEGEAGLLAHPIVVSDRFVLFDEKALALLEDSSNNKGGDLTTSISGLNLGSGDTEIIYVIAPSRESMMADKLPEGYVYENKLFDQTIKAIYDVKKDNVSFIDLREAFANAKDYPLFYDTYSGWTDYAAYIAYFEIMSYIAEKFPDAAPRNLDEFDIKEVDAYLGDLAGYLGLDREMFTEKVYDFVPKFNLDIGKEYAVNTQKAPVTEESEDNREEELYSGFSEEIEDVVISEDVVVESSEEASSSEEDGEEESEEPEEVDEEFLETFSLISDIKLTIGEKDYRFYNTEFKDEFYTTDTEYNPVLSDSEFAFGTNRTDLYLPSALIYRSNNTAPIVPMLAERFRNSVFNASGVFSIQGTKAKDYAGTPGNTNVDYVIVIITEEDLAQLYK